MYLSAITSRLLLYDANSWDLKKSYGCYDGSLRDISWSDDSKYLLQVNCKGLVEILSAAEHDVRSLQHIPLKDTWSASFHRDGHRNIAIGTKSGNVLIWDTKNKTIIKTFPTPPHQSSVNHISYNAKNTSLASTMQNGDTIIYGLVSNIPVLTVKLLNSHSISAMKFHHESRSLLGLATEEGHVLLRDITTNKDKAYFENIHASPVSDFAYSLVNKDVMLSCGFDKVMHVYDVRLQNVVSTIRTSYTLTSLALNIENQVALGTKNGAVLLYDLRDLSNPLKVLKGHEEVKKVTFQPVRKKLYSNDISLHEDNETRSPTKLRSPIVNNRTSDMFFVADSPTKMNLNASSPKDNNNDDSFLVMMGLNKSNTMIDEHCNRSVEIKSDKYEKYTLEPEKDVSKMSTPMNANSKKPEQFSFSSPACAMNGIPDDGTCSMNNDMKNLNIPNNFTVNIEMKTMEELKDFIKLNIADMADDNRNYFLHVMMALTKQKLFLEKQLVGINDQMKTLMHNQNALVETNRRLAMEIEQLKSSEQLNKNFNKNF